MGEVGAYGSYLLETFVTLVAVCAVAFVVLYGARRMGIGQPSGDIRLVGRLPLDARRAVYLVGVGEQVFVVGVAEGGMTKLGEVSAASLHAPTDMKPVAFGEVLARVLGRSRDHDTDAAARAGEDEAASGATARAAREHSAAPPEEKDA